MEPKRLEKTSRLALAAGFGSLMCAVMLFALYLSVGSPEALFFSIMYLAFSAIPLTEYGRLHRLAVKEELREYVDKRFDEVIAEIRKLGTKQPARA